MKDGSKDWFRTSPFPFFGRVQMQSDQIGFKFSPIAHWVLVYFGQIYVNLKK
jgi:hypothetical protein